MSTTCLITGATGCVGGHLADACARRGFAVRGLARPGSDISVLEGCGAEVVRGDLIDRGVVQTALEGVDVVFHCAAKVGDWGPVEEYRAVNVEALRGLLEACRGRSLQRFVHFSSLGVYAARHHYGTDETEPLPARQVDGYTQTKVESEQLVLRYNREHGVPVAVLRPGFIYGPRDRTVLPNLIEKLRRRQVRYLGSGRQALNCIFVGNLVDAALLAAEKPAAVGQVYNLTDGEAVSKRGFIEAVADGVGVPRPPPVGAPLWLARAVAWWMEGAARRRGATEAPRLTQGRLKFLGLNLDFSIEKAKRELGYRPRVSFDEGMRQTVEWNRGREVGHDAGALGHEPAPHGPAGCSHDAG
jgi:nucleoside-diphosphate-sugar epimerase